MYSILLYFSWKRIQPQLFGEIVKPLVLSNDSSILERSLQSACDNCGNQSSMIVYESFRKWKIFGIPLGRSDYNYDVVCKACGAFNLRFGSREEGELKKKGILKDLKL